MYTLIVILLMFVLPIISILVEIFLFKTASGIIPLIGKWFVFWAGGIRLFTAGLRQAITPQFTAEAIFGIKSSEALIIVQELGFANLSIGTLGIATIFKSAWVMPAAIAGCLFYGFASIRHLIKKEKNYLENVATISDLFIFIVMLAYFIGTIVQ